MAGGDPFAIGSGGGGSGGDPFSAGRKSNKPKKSQPSAAEKFVHNFAGDVEGMAKGFLPGVKVAVTHPIRTAEQLGKAYSAAYSPLLHGHFGEFGHQFFEHPAGYVLDLGSVVDLGAGTAARGATLLGKAGLVSAERAAQLSRAAELTYRGPVALAQAGRLHGGLERFAQEAKPVTRKGSHNPARQERLDQLVLDSLDAPMQEVRPRTASPIEERAKTITREGSRNPARRWRQEKLNQALNRLDPHTPVFGELARYARQSKRLTLHESRLITARLQSFRQVWHRLDKYERVAWSFIADRVHPLDEAKALAAKHPDFATNPDKSVTRLAIEVAQHPKVIAAYENPSKILLQTAKRGKELSDFLGTHRVERGLLDKKTVAERPFLHARLRAGGRMVTQAEVDRYRARAEGIIEEMKNYVGKPQGWSPSMMSQRDALQRSIDKAQPPDAAKVNALIRSLEARRAEAARGLERHRARVGDDPGDTSDISWRRQIREAEQQIAELRQLLKQPRQNTRGLEQMLAELEKTAAKPVPYSRPTDDGGWRPSEIELRFDADNYKPGVTGGKSIKDIRADLQAEGHGDPFYYPSIPLTNARKPSLSPRGLGRGVPKREGATRLNEAVLHSLGALMRDPEALDIGTLRYARFVLADSIHNELLANGIKVEKGSVVDSSRYYLLREKASERIPFIHQVQGEVANRLTELESLFGKERDALGEFVTKNPSDALMVDDHYLIVPKAYADKLAGEFARSNGAFRALWDKPTSVWRALVLGLRVGFFTNNVVGNYILLALRHHGPDGFKAWISLLREVRGEKWTKQFVTDEAERNRTFRTVVEDTVPELLAGTFNRSQFEDLPAIGKLGRFRHGVGPATVRVAEDTPRMLVAREVVIKRARELKRDIPKQTEEFNQLAREMLADPKVQAHVVDEANRTLGDYLNVPGQGLRQVIPFYSWIQAITRIAGNALSDSPAKVDLLAHLGDLAVKENESKYGPLPPYLMAMIPLVHGKDGTIVQLGTQGLNPLATVGDVAHAAGGFAAGQPGAGGDAFAAAGVHPFIQAMFEWSSGKTFHGQTARPTILPGLPGYMAGSVFGTVPPVALGKQLAFGGKPSAVYDNTRLTALGQYAGLPIRRVNLAAAHRQALGKKKKKGSSGGDPFH